jgi:hypothetical protein
MQWYNTRIINSCELEHRFENHGDVADGVKRSKSITDLALKDYLKGAASKESPDPEFKTRLIG